MTHPFPEWVPQEIIDGYAEKGVRYLFDWQHEIIQSVEDRNLVFSAPTSAGKSLVAELAALRTALNGKKVIFVVPYISLAKEKLHFLQRLWRAVDITVAGFIGPQSPPASDWLVAICTTEKANSLLNHAATDGRLKPYGLIVFDELHMITDSSRGPTLESLISKILFYNKSSSSPIQLIGMSATIPNLASVGSWMTAQVKESDFRPISLNEAICSDGILKDVNSGKEVRRLDTTYRFPGDIDCTIGLAVEGFCDKKLVLVFCSSKNEVERVAIEIAKTLAAQFKLSESLIATLNKDGLLSIKRELEDFCRNLDPVLMKTLPRGVAFHHAGLTSEERECIEKAFRDGIVRILVSTSTLSSGVNLPANRVIIKAQTRGPASLNNSTYLQMAGRAGRLGHSDSGESVVVAKPSEVSQVLRLIKTTPHNGTTARDPSKLILEGISTGLATSVSSCKELTSCLFYSHSRSTEDSLCYLTGSQLIASVQADEEKEDILLEPTQLGKAALASSLPPDAAMFVYNDLENATKAIALDTELHMLYLVTPVNCQIWQGCDWDHLYNIFKGMDKNGKRVAKMVGVNERFLLLRLQGRHVNESDNEYKIHLRFFSALALACIVSEQPLGEVAENFRLPRGALQTLQQQSATYAMMIVAFCTRLGWQYLRSLLDGFAERLAFGVRSELTELVRIMGIDARRARGFHEQGITSLAQLAQCTIKEVSSVLSLAVPFDGVSEENGRAEWLFGEDKMRIEDAAKMLIVRAGEYVSERLRDLGIEFIPNAPNSKPSHSDSSSGIRISFSTQNPPSQLHPKLSQAPPRSQLPFRTQPQPMPNTQSRAPPQSNPSFSIETDIGCTQVGLTTSADDETESKDTGYDSFPSSNQMSSTPIGKIPPKLSLSCSQIEFEDNSVDLFADSMMEMTLDEKRESADGAEVLSARNENDPPLTLSNDIITINDISQPIYDDSFDRPVEIVKLNAGEPVKAKNTLDIYEDSFDIPQAIKNTPLGEIKLSSSSSHCTSRLKQATNSPLCSVSSANNSNDLFDIDDKNLDSPVMTRSSSRRRRSALSDSNCWSPTASSPVGKKLLSMDSKKTFHVDDVCRSLPAWASFVRRSAHWTSFSAHFVTNISGQIQAIAVCHQDCSPEFIPLRDQYFPGNKEEEKLCASSTPIQELSVETRLSHLRTLFLSCQVCIYDAMKYIVPLREQHDIIVKRPVCLALLTFLAQMRCGERPLSLTQAASKRQWDFEILALMKMNPRLSAAASAFVTQALFQQIRCQAIQHSSQQSVNLEIEALEVISSMSFEGFKLDSKVTNHFLETLKRELNTLETDCHELAKKPFNLESAAQVASVLYTTLRLPCPGGQSSKTSKRHIGTSKAVLEQMRGSHPIVEKIILYRKLKHALSQSVLPLASAISDDGLIRTTFDVATATGRILSHQPNLQNLPKDELINGLRVRNLLAARDGYTILCADYNQLELRVLAHLSADQALIRRLSNDDRDFFSDLAREWGFERKAVKQLCYGIIYGMGAKSLAEEMKSSLEDAERLIKSFFDSFPKVHTFIQTQREKASSGVFVATMLGRRRLGCNRGNQEEKARNSRQAVNFVIQGTASEIFKKAIVDIHHKFKDTESRIVLTVHDEVVVECVTSELSAVAETVKNCMECAFPLLRVPMRVKISSGSSWGEVSK